MVSTKFKIFLVDASIKKNLYGKEFLAFWDLVKTLLHLILVEIYIVFFHEMRTYDLDEIQVKVA